MRIYIAWIKVDGEIIECEQRKSEELAKKDLEELRERYYWCDASGVECQEIYIR